VLLVLISLMAGFFVMSPTRIAHAASSIDLTFNSLPSTQGFTYFQSAGIPEANVFFSDWDLFDPEHDWHRPAES
jgi:hypothetical protein